MRILALGDKIDGLIRMDQAFFFTVRWMVRSD